jgi:membrane protease YdiL (CAAX protease family)
VWLPALSLFFGSGFGEQIFFRGYIQSRVDQAFGCPFRLLGFDSFGGGLLVSSLLFGLIHVLNLPLDIHGNAM